MEGVRTMGHVALPKWHLRTDVSDIQLEDVGTAVMAPLLE